MLKPHESLRERTAEENASAPGRETAGPSTALRSGRDDNSVGPLTSHSSDRFRGHFPATELSSRPERTRIPATRHSPAATCAAFSKESRVRFANATDLNRKSGERSGGTCGFSSGSHADTVRPPRQTSAQTRGGSSRLVHLFTKTFLSAGRRTAKRFVFGSLRVSCQKEGVRRINLLTTYDQGCNTPSTLETST